MSHYFSNLGYITNSCNASADGISAHESTGKERQATQEVGMVSIPGCIKKLANWEIVGLCPEIMSEWIRSGVS